MSLFVGLKGRCIRDPRLYQIAALSSLLAYGMLVLEFDVSFLQILVFIGSALLVQACCTWWFGLARFDPKSALISSLSLSLLFRTDILWLVVLATVITISSKFLIRCNNKHVFNPTNLGLASMMLLTDRAWVSQGQWGTLAFFTFLMACAGILVVYRSARSDVTFAFIVAYSALLLGRAIWLGDPLQIPLHHLQNGAFLLFAFFMLSDPKTTPDRRVGRILYACMVAALAMFIQFGMYQSNALIWSLVCCAPLVPVIDRVLKGKAYRWPEYLQTIKG